MSEQPGTADTMRERSGQHTAKLWLLVSADRLAVTVVIGLSTFFAFIIIVSILEPPIIPHLEDGTAIATLFSTLLSAVTLVTALTVTIGQVVLAQENGPLGDQHMRMSNAMDVRSYVADIVGKPSPITPATFLREIVIACEERARHLQQLPLDAGNQQLEDDVDAVTHSVIGNAETVNAQLSGRTFGTFDVISAGVGFNYGRKIYEIEQLIAEHGDVLEEPERSALDELRTALSMFAPAREHVKTLYFQWELINLSRKILYLSIPALLVAGVMVTVVEPVSFPGATLGVDNILWVIAGAFTLTLMPFFLLAAYILRLVSIAQETLAVEPFILRNSGE